MTIHSSMSDISYSCVQWNTAATSTDIMLLRTFQGGCRPRYTCIKQLRQSNSLLYLKLSHTTHWPIISSSTDPLDCDSFTYDRPHHGSAASFDLSITAQQSLLLLRGHSVVQCGTHQAHYHNFWVTFRENSSGSSCQANVSLTKEQTGINIISDGCPVNQLSSMAVFMCLDSFELSSAEHKLIISEGSAALNRTAVWCWLFLKPTSHTMTFYLLNATQCHNVMRTDTKLDNLYHYHAVFTSKHKRSHNGRPSSSIQRTYSHSTSASTQDATTVAVPSPTVTVNSSEEATTETISRNPIVISSAVVILAIVQALVFCGCI